MERRLAAILAADVVGFSRKVSRDEEGTIARIAVLRDELLNLVVAGHGGRIFKAMGDGILAEFPSAVECVRAAEEIQTRLREQNNRLAVDLRMDMRIGLNLGDIVVQGYDVLGDGVNVAARLEQLAPPGGVLLSAAIHDQVSGKLNLDFRDQGFQTLKNIPRPVHVYSFGAEQEGASMTGGGMFDFGDAMERKPLITGRCFCGNVRLETHEEALGSGYCHCTFCQRFTGAPVAVWTAFRDGAIRFVTKPPKTFRSSLIGERGFCPECGTAMTYRLLKPSDCGYLVIYTTCLDRPEAFAPTAHGGIESKVPWLEINDNLPRTRCDDSWALRTAWASVGRPDPKDWTPSLT